MAAKPGFWNAPWVSPTPNPQGSFGAWVFRRVIDLDHAPTELVVKVSADQRFRFYVNGVLAAHGPARGDGLHWPYDELDIAPLLKSGRNVLHCVVWWLGWSAPMAQMSHQAAFIFEGEGLSTPNGWECARAPGRSFISSQPRILPTYFACGPCEVMEPGAPALEDLGEAEADWLPVTETWSGNANGGFLIGPITLMKGKEEGSNVGEAPWWLARRTLPPMLYRKWEGGASIVDRSTDQRTPFVQAKVGAGKSLLLDFGELVNGYPRIRLKGAGLVQVVYAESLFLLNPDEPWRWIEGKAHRDKTAGFSIMGQSDRVQLDGEALFEPLWWRCFRYVQIEAEDGCEVESFEVMETGYPMPLESSWESDDHRDDEIMKVAVRTARRCAGETYFDCPYYEQLQYVADTRIQAMVGRFINPDRRLQKQAVDAFANSVFHSGLTQSRYPSREIQVIPGFSLWWIHMVADQHWYDPEGIDPRHLELCRGVLNWWEDALHDKAAGGYWSYADWVPAWDGGNPPGGIKSSVQVLLMLYTKIVFAKLVGDHALLTHCRDEAAEWQEDQDGRVYHGSKGWDSPLCQHTAALIRLCRHELGDAIAPWPAGTSKGFQASLFYQWYIHQARPYEDYSDLLAPWHRMLDLGLTTFAETEEPTRSDCHAWSAHPILGFFQRIAGISSAAPGWAKAHIQPNPRGRRWFDARAPHPQGVLRVAMHDTRLVVQSPVPFRLVWEGRTEDHSAGEVTIDG